MKAVIFDCFGVLYVDSSHAFYEQSVANYEQVRPRLMELNAQSDYGLISQQEWLEQVAETIGVSAEAVQQGIEGVHVRNQVLLDYSQTLRQRGLLVGLLSNVGRGGMDRYFSPAERDQLFDAVVLSGEVMMTKPSSAIFALMAERLGVSAGDCIMVDDAPANCAGADAAGMRTVYYTSTTQAITEISSHIEKSIDVSILP